MSLHSITCEEISPLLDAYHDGELDKAERDNVAGHLTSCPSCQSKLVEIESVVSSLKNLPRLQMTRDLTADPEYLKRAMEIIQAGDKDGAKAPEKTGAEIKEFPVRKQASVFGKGIFPLPGPVIFASVAAAAALALVLVVPRYLTSTNSPTVAIAPKQTNPKLDLNPHTQTVTPETSAAPELKVAHNPVVTPDISQDSTSHQPIHNIAQVNENAPAIKDLPAQAPPEIASLPTNSEPASAMVSPSVESASPPAVQAISQGDQTPEEIPASATATAEPAELLALYPGDTTTVTDELAIPTDEDGLYALKL